jgi:hypothetical protein
MTMKDTITVSWDAVTQDVNNNPTAPSTYKIYVSPNNTAFVFNSQVAGDKTQQIFTNRPPGTWQYKIHAVNVAGVESIDSVLSDVIIVSDPNVAPKAPTNVVATLS